MILGLLLPTDRLDQVVVEVVEVHFGWLHLQGRTIPPCGLGRCLDQSLQQVGPMRFSAPQAGGRSHAVSDPVQGRGGLVLG